MKRYGEREVTKQERVLLEIVCDECKESIDETEHNFYYEVVTSHGLRGNDSVDSSEYLDICCWECLINNQEKYFANAGDTCRYDIEVVEK